MNKKLDYKNEYLRLSHFFRSTIKEKIRKTEGLTQSLIAKQMIKSQNAINNWITENQKYQCLPNAIDFLILCKILKMNPNLFLNPSDLPVNEKTLDSLDNNLNQTFISTSISEKINQILLDCAMKKELSIIITQSNNGTTTAIDNFICYNGKWMIKLEDITSKESIYNQIAQQYQLPSAERLLQEQQILMIKENTELLNQRQIDILIETFYQKHPVVLVYKESIAHKKMENLALTKYYLNSITKIDLQKITNQLLPGISPKAMKLIESLSRGRIQDLVKYIRIIRQSMHVDQKITASQIIKILYP